MDAKALGITLEAERYAERHRDSAAKLRAQEAERRWKGEPMDELEVRRVASFLKSYNEMMNGEMFVVREVRGRAREASRWAMAAVLVAAAIALAWRPSLALLRRRAAPPPAGTAPPASAR
jgi:hypothetical protein